MGFSNVHASMDDPHVCVVQRPVQQEAGYRVVGYPNLEHSKGDAYVLPEGCHHLLAVL